MFHLAPGALDGAAAGTVVTLTGAEGHHAATVMRLAAGEQIQLSDTRGIRAGGVVLSAGDGQLSVEVQELTLEPALRPQLVLVQALAKDKRDLQAVESATELGVDAVIPWEAQRSVARWKPGREAKKHAEWVNTVRSAAKQTRRTVIPEVRGLHTTAQYLHAVRGDQGVDVIVLHELEEKPLRESLEEVQEAQELHLVVGPEGGITDSEVEQLLAAGARTARLGPHVLRSSTAGPAALAAVQLLLGRWDS
nr:16S rRNA (uracil(1498)-N(3))-methyltransferase [Nesterenkonia alkaliphila]